MGDAYAALMFEDNTNFLECVGRRAEAELFITHLGADVVWGDQPAVLLRGVVTIIGHSTFHVEVRASQYDNWDFSGRKSGTRVVHRLLVQDMWTLSRAWRRRRYSWTRVGDSDQPASACGARILTTTTTRMTTENSLLTKHLPCLHVAMLLNELLEVDLVDIILLDLLL